MVGAVYILTGVLRLGFLTDYISHTVVNGFTSAAALIIGFSQVRRKKKHCDLSHAASDIAGFGA